MTGDITAMSWNVRGEIGISDDRMQRQLRFLDDHTTDIDFFSFQAVNYEKGSAGDREGQLGVFLDYFSTISRLTTTMSYTLVTGHESSQNQVFSLTQTLMPRTTAVISSLVDGRSSADH